MSISDLPIQSNFFTWILNNLRSRKHWNEKRVENFLSYDKALIAAFYSFIKRNEDPAYVDSGLAPSKDDDRDENRNKIS